MISLKEMLRLDGADRVKLEKLVDETPDRYEWAEKMNALIGRYI